VTLELQTIFNLHNGGCQHFGFPKLLFLTQFCVEAADRRLVTNFMQIGLPVRKLQAISDFQDGGCRHIGFRKVRFILPSLLV
jgi:hypothetical protein